MSEIPLEVQMHAERLYDDGGYESVPTIIAKAIMAERERCAEIMRSRAEKSALEAKAANDHEYGFHRLSADLLFGAEQAILSPSKAKQVEKDQ